MHGGHIHLSGLLYDDQDFDISVFGGASGKSNYREPSRTYTDNTSVADRAWAPKTTQEGSPLLVQFLRSAP